jgi:hypothetical protein
MKKTAKDAGRSLCPKPAGGNPVIGEHFPRLVGKANRVLF